MTRPHSSLTDRLTHPLAALLLIGLIAALIYSNTFSASFHFDDVPNITDNPRIKHLQNLLDFSGSRYVGFLSFALNYHFAGLSLFGFHIVNLLIHIANGVLVYWLIRLFFQSPRLIPPPAFAPAAPAIALFTALLFVVHPVQTQAVTYIVQRFASLASLFYLFAVFCYLKWRLSSPEFKRRHLWYAAAFLATILAMKTKEITFTLPFMLLLVEYVGFGLPTRKQWIGLIPFFLTLPIIPLSRPGALGEGEAGFARDAFALSRPDYLFTQCKVIMTYLRILVLPVNQNLDYDFPASHSLFEPPVFLSFLFLSALITTAVYLLFVSRRAAADPRLRIIAFGILWFFLTLSIESSIIPIRDVIYEHRLYLPSIGFWLAVTTALFGFFPRRRVPVAVGLAGLILLLGFTAYQRNRIWQDEISLWSDVVHHSPNKARPHNNLGVAYADQKRTDEAVSEYKTAIALDPNYADAHNNLGNSLEDLGKHEEAMQEYKTVLMLNPRYARAYYNVGMFYYARGEFSKALEAFEEAIRVEPNLAEARNNLGTIYKENGKYDEAIEQYKKAISLKPDYADAHINLGVAYKKLGRFNEALIEYQTALALNPNQAETHNNLGIVYKKLNRLDEAVQEYKTALRLKPDSAEVHNNLGNAFQEKKQTDEAIQEYKTALSLKPDYIEAHYNLGMSYYQQGDLSKALGEFNEAARLNPEFAEAHNSIGEIYKELGRNKEAIQEFQTALKLQPNMAEGYYNLGDSYQRLGEVQNAIFAFENALKINPDHEKSRRALDSLRR
jgi:tetratricopeptide (TPR) repeat protein